MKLEFPLGKLSHIGIIDNFLSEDFCSELLKFCKENYEDLFEIGQMVGGLNIEHKNSFDWPMTGEEIELTKDKSDIVKKFDLEIYNKFNKALFQYISNYPQMKTWEDARDTGYRVQHYLRNQGFYKSHIDGGSWYRDGVEKRTLAAVMYLNTVQEGGGTHFDQHDYTVDAIAGRIAIFPATWTHPHGGLIPVSEDKWIISSFVC